MWGFSGRESRRLASEALLATDDLEEKLKLELEVKSALVRL